MLDQLNIAMTIYTCCVLHNICIDENDDDEFIDSPTYRGFLNDNRREEAVQATFENEEETSEEFVLPSAAATAQLKAAAEGRRQAIMRDLMRR